MKTITNFLTVAFFFVFTANTFAQVSLGVRGGVNWANIHATQTLDNIIPNFKSIDNYNFGIVAEIAITDQFAFQPELGFTKKGFGVNEGLDVPLFGVDIPLGLTAESQFSYVEVPLLGKYKFGTEGLSAYLMAGPTVGVATSGRLVTKADVFVTEINLTNTPINLDAIDYQRLEIGGTLGAGVAVHTGFGQIFADARYSRGFTQLYDIPLVNERVSNSGFGVNVGVMMPIGGPARP